MKKTIQVNLSGQVFTLDEDAYDRLASYLNQIGRLYQNSPGKDEILQDIEVRIAELFTERLDDTREVVNLSDVDHIVEIMGRPEQFDEGFEAEEAQHTNTSFRSKRLYRDPDDQVIGGVCAGIGHYFGIDPLWIRLAFAGALVFFGTGVLLYIILLIAVPEAKTTAEKLHMKGEPVNISSIGKSIEDELNNFGEKISGQGGAMAKGTGKKLANGIDRFVYFILELLRNIFKFIGKFLGVLFLAIGVFWLIAIVAGVSGIADFIHFSSEGWNASMDVYEWSGFIFESSEWVFAAVMGGMLLVGIPFLALAYGGFLLLFPDKKVPYLGLSLFGLWFVGLVMTVFSVLGVHKVFSKEDTVVETIHLDELGISSDTLVVSLGDDPFNIDMHHAYRAADEFMIKVEDKVVSIGNVEVNVLRASDGHARVELRKTSGGDSFTAAKIKAEHIEYKFHAKGNKLMFDAYFNFPQSDMFRAQEIEVLVLIPEGMTVYLDESSNRVIRNIPNVTNTYDPYMVGHHWRMERNGLTCLDCKSSKDDEEVEEEPEEIEEELANDSTEV